MATVFEDDFNRTNASAWGNSWSIDGTVPGSGNVTSWSVAPGATSQATDGFNAPLGPYHTFTEIDTFDILLKALWKNADDSLYFGVGNVAGDYGYSLEFRGWYGTEGILRRMSNLWWNDPEDGGDFSSNVDPAANDVVCFRFAYDGADLMVRTWLDGDTEPSTWDHTWTPATALTGFDFVQIGSRASSNANQPSFSYILVTDGQEPGTAAITGTATASIDEADIIAGGKTIIATLTGDTFVPASQTNIQLVGRQSGSFAGTTTAQTITFALTGGLASTPAAGDLVFVSYAVGTAGRTPSMVIENTSAVAYTDALPSSIITSDDTFDVRLRAAWRVMPGTPETQVRFAGGSGNNADAAIYDILVLRTVDPTTPMDVTAVEASGQNGRAANPPSITPSTAGAWTFHVGAAAGGTGGTFTSPDLSDFLAGTRADTNDAFMGAGLLSKGWSSGAQDPGAFTGGGTTTTNDAWAAFSVAFRPVVSTPFADARQAIIDGLDSAQSEAAGWNAEVRDNLGVSAVVRTSDTVCTITLSAQAGYQITAQETITVTLPATALAGGAAIVGTPTFTVATGAGAVDLAGAVTVTSGASAARLDVARALTAAQTVTSGAAAARLDVDIPIAGAVTVTSSAPASRLDLDIPIVAAQAVTSDATGELALKKLLEGSAAASSGASAARLDVSRPLLGAVTVTSSATGTAIVDWALAGSSAAVSGAPNAPLSNLNRIEGSASATSGASGELRVVKSLEGLAAATSSAAAAALPVAKPCAGAVTVTSSASGSLGLEIPLAGTTAASSSASGSLALLRPLEGSSAATSSAPAARLDVARPLLGAVTVSTDSPAARLDLDLALLGLVAVLSGASGELGGIGIFVRHYGLAAGLAAAYGGRSGSAGSRYG